MVQQDKTTEVQKYFACCMHGLILETAISQVVLYKIF